MCGTGSSKLPELLPNVPLVITVTTFVDKGHVWHPLYSVKPSENKNAEGRADSACCLGKQQNIGLWETVLNDICNGLFSLFKANIICLPLC